MQGLFRTITLRGQHGEINRGFRLAARLSSWVIARDGETLQWSLRAAIERADTFQLSQRPLQFTAPRYAKPAGIWAFEVRTIDVKGDGLTATLGPPMRG